MILLFGMPVEKRGDVLGPAAFWSSWHRCHMFSHACEPSFQAFMFCDFDLLGLLGEQNGMARIDRKLVT